MNNQEIKEKLENDSLILANQLMAFVQNPPALKYMDEIRDSIQKTISKTKTESFNLGVTLSVEEGEYHDKDECGHLIGQNCLCGFKHGSKQAILKLLIK